MKKLFRKAMTIVGGAALIGSTVALAAAASYPEPFTSNTAIVVGANAAPSDNIAAASIASNLDANAASDGMTTITTDGDSYKFEKTSTKLHLGDSITDIRSQIDEDQMPTLLADGTYTDVNNDEFDYTQSITIASKDLTLFDNNDYKRDTPTIGLEYSSGDNVLNYTLDFSDEPTIADMETTDLNLMGKDYYVLEAAYNKLTLLDSAANTIVAEGETSTITAGGKTYTVSIEYVGETSVKLNVNGEVTNTLSLTANTYKLDDGAYVGLKDILYSAKDTGISKVEFSIGNGKLVLTDGADVEMNDDTIDGLMATIVNATDALSSVTLSWDTDDDVFVTEDSVATMPGFDTISLSFTGMDYPTDEAISLSYDGENSVVLSNFPLKDSTEDINLLYKADGANNFTGLGKDNDEEMPTGDQYIVFDKDTDAYFIASYNDGSDTESYMMKADNFKTDNGVDKVTFYYKKDGSWTEAKTDRKDGEDVSLGNVEFTVDTVNKDDKTVNFTATGDTHFNVLYSAEGFAVNLPVEVTTVPGDNEINFNSTYVSSNTDYVVRMAEEDKDGDTASGGTINVTAIGDSDTNKVSIDSVAIDGSAFNEIDNSDVYQAFTYSALATELMWDKGDSNQKTLDLTYHGSEVEAGVYLTSSDAVSMSGDAGVMTVKDSEVATVAGKNLVVVGGSAINTVAAELLGGAYSEAAFTSATGVGAGEFLIQSFNRAGKTALLVAGYNAADTEKAVTYLLNNDVDTTVGMKMKGTSATEATVVTA